MDVRMPGDSGIDTCRQITSRWPETRVIMLASFADSIGLVMTIQEIALLLLVAVLTAVWLPKQKKP